MTTKLSLIKRTNFKNEVVYASSSDFDEDFGSNKACHQNPNDLCDQDQALCF